MAGKKVRCSCGKTIRLPQDGQSLTKPLSNKSAQTRSASRSSDPAKVKSRSTESVDPFALHYSDLDDILSGAVKPESDVPLREPSVEPKRTPRKPIHLRNPPLHSTSPEVTAEMAGQSTPPQPAPAISRFRHSLLFLSTLAAAATAFWLAVFLISVRLASIQIPALNSIAESMHQIYTGEFGWEGTTATLKMGFVTAGWIIVVGAVLLLLASLIQFASGIVHLFSGSQILRWSDGLMATISICVVFLLIVTLFLHAAHTQNLLRQVNQVTVGIQAEAPIHVVRLREQYRQQAQTFTWSVAAIAVPATIIFGFSMLRLMIRPQPAN